MAYDILNPELMNDPLTRGYSGMTDSEILTSLTAIDRPKAGGPEPVRSFFVKNKNRTNQGADTTADWILGRLVMVAASTTGGDPFGRGAGNELSQKQLIAAKAMKERLTWPNNALMQLFSDAEIDELLTDLVDAGVMGNADKTTLQGLTNNLQSRADELGIAQGWLNDRRIARARL